MITGGEMMGRDSNYDCNLKAKIVSIKQGSNLAEGLSQNIVLQFVVIPYREEYFSAYLWGGWSHSFEVKIKIV